MSTAAPKLPQRLPTADESSEAKEAAKRVASLLRHKTSRTINLSPEGARRPEETIPVPREAFAFLLEILRQIANGNAVTIVPVHAELTSQEAADLLNVSRPYLIKLLDEKKIPHRLVGTHRRIRFVDLVKYKQQDDAERQKALDELSALAQKHGFGY